MPMSRSIFATYSARATSSETEQGGGASVKVTLESEQDIEGCRQVSKRAVETEAHAEFSETEGSETSQEQEGSRKARPCTLANAPALPRRGCAPTARSRSRPKVIS